MDKAIIDFLNREQVCVLSTISTSGFPEAAAMHFWLKEKPFKFYFLTDKSTRKYQNMEHNNKASLTIGLQDSALFTVQTNGIIDQAPANTIEEVKTIHFKKYPDDIKWKHKNPAYLSFTPVWIRVRDNRVFPPSAKIVLSEDSGI